MFIAENLGESLRKELMDVRRQLGDSTFEKEKYNTSNKELRETIKRSEGEKREQARALDEAFQKISCNNAFCYVLTCLKIYESFNLLLLHLKIHTLSLLVSTLDRT